MKVKRVNRYYCDHCKKSGCGKSALMKHERGCMRNPGRVCGFCEILKKHGHEHNRRLLRTLIVVLREFGLQRLQKEAKWCPGCIFAAIIQSRQEQLAERIASHGNDRRWGDDGEELWAPREGWLFAEEFDFKKHSAAFWDELNASEEYYQSFDLSSLYGRDQASLEFYEV